MFYKLGMFFFTFMRYSSKSALQIVIFCISIILWLFFLTYFVVPFSKLLCQDTGPNGLYGLFLDLKKTNPVVFIPIDFILDLKNKIFWFTLVDEQKKIYENRPNSNSLRFINVSVVFKTNDLLPLAFNSSVEHHRVSVNNPELLFCDVTNNSNSDQIFTSIYNVYPAEVLPYLEKIQCFCYDDQIVEAGSKLHLPVYYKINSNILNDPVVKNVTDIVISYAIFKA